MIVLPHCSTALFNHTRGSTPVAVFRGTGGSLCTTQVTIPYTKIDRNEPPTQKWSLSSCGVPQARFDAPLVAFSKIDAASVVNRYIRGRDVRPGTAVYIQYAFNGLDEGLMRMPAENNICTIALLAV